MYHSLLPCWLRQDQHIPLGKLTPDSNRHKFSFQSLYSKRRLQCSFLCFFFINIHLIAFDEKVMSMYWHAKQHGMFVFRIPFSSKKVTLTQYLNSSSWNVRLHSLLSRLLNCKSPLSIIADLAVGFDYILHHIPDG